MASITIRRLDDAALVNLKEAAKAHNRSTEAEARSILEEYTAEFVAHKAVSTGDFFEQIRKELEGGLKDDELDIAPRQDGPRPAVLS